MKINDVSVRHKLMLAIGVPILALVGAVWTTVWGLGYMDRALKTVYDQRIVPLKDLTVIVDRYAVDVIDAVNKANAGMFTAEQAAGAVKRARADIEKYWHHYTAHDVGTEEQRVIDQAAKLMAAADQELDRLLAHLRTLSGTVKGKLDQFDGPLYESIDVVSEKLTELEELQLQLASRDRDQADEFITTVDRWEIIFATLVIGLSVVLGLWIFRTVVGPLSELRRVSEQVARDSDLTLRVEVRSQDEFGMTSKAFNSMIETLKSLVEQIAGSTVQLASAAEEMSAISEQTSQGINRQTRETEQVATAMNEMTSTVQEVARNAGNAAESAREADTKSQEGTRVVDGVIASIRDVDAAVKRGADTMTELEENSDKIGVVLDVIRGIAEQTNLLALNAAIEAARAGEQGRGFAVVADEVRTLASRTQESTQEIEQMIGTLQAGAKQAAAAMGEGQERATRSVESAEQAGAALADIARAVSVISDINAQIASAAEQQGAVADEINRNVSAINEIGGETAQGATQAAGASTDMARLATELQEVVGRFKT